MSKGLEALKHLYNEYILTEYPDSILKDIDKDKETIEKELKILEWYDNLGKPTSGIMPKKEDYRLNQLLNGFEYIDQENIRSLCQKRYEEIVDIICENETNKKILQILKEKKVYIQALFEMSFREYNDYCKYVWLIPTVTKEEYDLLKEVLL